MNEDNFVEEWTAHYPTRKMYHSEAANYLRAKQPPPEQPVEQPDQLIPQSNLWERSKPGHEDVPAMPDPRNVPDTLSDDDKPGMVAQFIKTIYPQAQLDDNIIAGIVGDFARPFTDNPAGPAMAGGVRDLGQGLVDVASEVSDALGLGPIDVELPQIESADDPAAHLVRGMTQFFAGFGAAGGLAKGATLMRQTLAGGAADATFDPELGNLSTLLREQFNWDNVLVNFLDAKVGEDADAAERLNARVKMVLEGAGLGALVPAAIFTMRQMKNGGPKAIQAVKDVIAGRPGNLEKQIGAINLSDAPINTVLSLRADQMKLPIDQRVQPREGDQLFDLSYERTLPEQIDTPVPRAPADAKLPKKNRGAKVVEMSNQVAKVLAKRAKPFIGTNVQYFYHTGPLIDKAVALGIPEQTAREQLKKFALNYAATSPRTQTEQNLRNASLVTAKQRANVPISKVIGPGGEGVNEKGYPMMINPGGIHKKLIDDAADQGINFDTNPKPATFAENVSGNLAGVTVDTHAIRAVFDVMNELDPGSIPIDFIGGRNAKETKKFREMYTNDSTSLDVATMIDDGLASQMINGQSMQTEYAIFSDVYKQVAKILKVQPAEAQSLSWFANGKKTGLGSDPKTIVELINDRVDVTAQLLNQSKDEVFKKFMQGAIPLLSLGGFTLLDTGAMNDPINANGGI
jgi:hypothetical protein